MASGHPAGMHYGYCLHAGRRGRRPLRKGCGAFITMTERYLVELQICYNPPPRFARHPPERGDEPRAPFQGAPRSGGGCIETDILPIER